MTLKALAEAGVFNRAGFTPMESAERAPLYDAFHYLAARTAESEYISNLSKE